MGADALATITTFVATYGVVVVLIVFTLEGVIVGKLFPTRILFVAAVVVLGSSTVGLASVFAAAVVGATAGQCVLFYLVRRTDFDPEALPGPITGRQVDRVDRWFGRWGLPAVTAANIVPFTRGYMTVPVALSEDVHALRFSLSSLLGTAVYACLLVLVGTGASAALSGI